MRRAVKVSGNPDHLGGVLGSFPVDGAYGRYEYLNRAAKFCVDSQLMELDLDAKTVA